MSNGPLPIGRIEFGPRECADTAPDLGKITLNILTRVLCNNCEGESTAALNNVLWRCKHCGKTCSYRRVR